MLEIEPRQLESQGHRRWDRPVWPVLEVIPLARLRITCPCVKLFIFRPPSSRASSLVLLICRLSSLYTLHSDAGLRIIHFPIPAKARTQRSVSTLQTVRVSGRPWPLWANDTTRKTLLFGYSLWLLFHSVRRWLLLLLLSHTCKFNLTCLTWLVWKRFPWLKLTSDYLLRLFGYKQSEGLKVYSIQRKYAQSSSLTQGGNCDGNLLVNWLTSKFEEFQMSWGEGLVDSYWA